MRISREAEREEGDSKAKRERKEGLVSSLKNEEIYVNVLPAN